MAIKSTEAKRLDSKKLQKAKDGITMLKKMEGYRPQRDEFAAGNIDSLNKELDFTSGEELRAQKALDKARDAAVKAEWNLYNFMLGAAEQVVGQYGGNSDEYASLGYKKKSEYKKTAPGTKAKKDATA